MKCRLNEKKNMRIMLVAGLAMIAVGALCGYALPDESHMLTRLAGMLTGMGFAFTVIAAAVLIWRNMVGETRARESEMKLQDERGQIIAGRAQSLLAIAAVLSLIVIDVTALLRGDELYMLLSSGLCLLCAVVKVIAMRVLEKRM